MIRRSSPSISGSPRGSSRNAGSVAAAFALLALDGPDPAVRAPEDWVALGDLASALRRVGIDGDEVLPDLDAVG